VKGSKKTKQRKHKKKKSLYVDTDTTESVTGYSDFNSYWQENGDYLVYQAWIKKYPDCVNQDSIPIPVAPEEVIMTTAQQRMDEGWLIEENECERVANTDHLDLEDEAGDENCHTLKSQIDRLIRDTMVSVRELDISSDEIHHQLDDQIHLISNMHGYAAKPSDELRQDNGPGLVLESGSSDEQLDKVIENENIQHQIQALWEEHYQETMWYYNNLFCNENQVCDITENIDTSNNFMGESNDIDGSRTIQFIMQQSCHGEMADGSFNPGQDINMDDEPVICDLSDTGVNELSADLDASEIMDSISCQSVSCDDLSDSDPQDGGTKRTRNEKAADESK